MGLDSSSSRGINVGVYCRFGCNYVMVVVVFAELVIVGLCFGYLHCFIQ